MPAFEVDTAERQRAEDAAKFAANLLASLSTPGRAVFMLTFGRLVGKELAEISAFIKHPIRTTIAAAPPPEDELRPVIARSQDGTTIYSPETLP